MVWRFTPLTTRFYDDRWYTSSRPLYFYHFRTLLIQVISHDMNIKGFIQFCAEGRSGHPWEMLWHRSRLGSCWDATRHIFSDGNLYIYIYTYICTYIYIYNLMIIVWWTMFFFLMTDDFFDLWWTMIDCTYLKGIQGCHGDLSIILIGIVSATFWCSRNRDLLTSIGCFSQISKLKTLFRLKNGTESAIRTWQSLTTTDV